MMKNLHGKICRLCFSNDLNGFESIDSNMKDMIEIVLPDLNINIFGKSILCIHCSSNLSKAFAFKSSCLEIEDNIHNYTNNGQVQVNLEKILGLNDMDDNTDDNESVKRSMRICRTCLDIVEFEIFTRLDGYENHSINHILQKCLPELDRDLTKDPGICDKCKHLASNTYNFISQCMDLELKIRDYVQSESPENFNVHNAYKYVFSEKDAVFILNSDVQILTEETEEILTMEIDTPQDRSDGDSKKIYESHPEYEDKIVVTQTSEVDEASTLDSYQEYDEKIITSNPSPVQEQNIEITKKSHKEYDEKSSTSNAIPVQEHNSDTRPNHEEYEEKTSTPSTFPVQEENITVPKTNTIEESPIEPASLELICESGEKTDTTRKRKYSGNYTSSSDEVTIIDTSDVMETRKSTDGPSKPRRSNTRRSCRLTTKLVNSKSDVDTTDDSDFRPDNYRSSDSDDHFQNYAQAFSSTSRNRFRRLCPKGRAPKKKKSTTKENVNNNFYLVIASDHQANGGQQVYQLVLNPSSTSVANNHPVLLAPVTGTNASGSSSQGRLLFTGTKAAPVTRVSGSRRTPMVVPQTSTVTPSQQSTPNISVPSYRNVQPRNLTSEAFRSRFISFPGSNIGSGITGTYPGNVTISQTSLQQDAVVGPQMRVCQGASVTSVQQSFVAYNQQVASIPGPSNNGMIGSYAPNVLSFTGDAYSTTQTPTLSVAYAEPTPSISYAATIGNNNTQFAQQTASVCGVTSIITDNGAGTSVPRMPIQQASLINGPNTIFTNNQISMNQMGSYQTTSVTSLQETLLNNVQSTLITGNTFSSLPQQTPSFTDYINNAPNQMMLQQIPSKPGNIPAMSITEINPATSTTGNELGTTISVTSAVPSITGNELGATTVSGICAQQTSLVNEVNPVTPISGYELRATTVPVTSAQQTPLITEVNPVISTTGIELGATTVSATSVQHNSSITSVREDIPATVIPTAPASTTTPVYEALSNTNNAHQTVSMTEVTQVPSKTSTTTVFQHALQQHLSTLVTGKATASSFSGASTQQLFTITGDNRATATSGATGTAINTLSCSSLQLTSTISGTKSSAFTLSVPPSQQTLKGSKVSDRYLVLRNPPDSILSSLLLKNPPIAKKPRKRNAAPTKKSKPPIILKNVKKPSLPSKKTPSSLPTIIDITGDSTDSYRIPTKRYYCAYCDHTSYSKSLADRHYNKCQSRSKHRKYFECLKCGYRENNDYLYKKHIKSCGKKKKAKTKNTAVIEIIDLDDSSSSQETQQNQQQSAKSDPVSNEIQCTDKLSEQNKLPQTSSVSSTKTFEVLTVENLNNHNAPAPISNSIELSEQERLALTSSVPSEKTSDISSEVENIENPPTSNSKEQSEQEGLAPTSSHLSEETSEVHSEVVNSENIIDSNKQYGVAPTSSGIEHSEELAPTSNNSSVKTSEVNSKAENIENMIDSNKQNEFTPTSSEIEQCEQERLAPTSINSSEKTSEVNSEAENIENIIESNKQNGLAATSSEIEHSEQKGLAPISIVSSEKTSEVNSEAENIEKIIDSNKKDGLAPNSSEIVHSELEGHAPTPIVSSEKTSEVNAEAKNIENMMDSNKQNIPAPTSSDIKHSEQEGLTSTPIVSAEKASEVNSVAKNIENMLDSNKQNIPAPTSSDIKHSGQEGLTPAPIVSGEKASEVNSEVENIENMMDSNKQNIPAPTSSDIKHSGQEGLTPAPIVSGEKASEVNSEVENIENIMDSNKQNIPAPTSSDIKHSGQEGLTPTPIVSGEKASEVNSEVENIENIMDSNKQNGLAPTSNDIEHSEPEGLAPTCRVVSANTSDIDSKVENILDSNKQNGLAPTSSASLKIVSKVPSEMKKIEGKTNSKKQNGLAQTTTSMEHSEHKTTSVLSKKTSEVGSKVKKAKTDLNKQNVFTPTSIPKKHKKKKSKVHTKMIVKHVEDKKNLKNMPPSSSIEQSEQKGLAVLKCDLCSFNARTYVKMAKHIRVHVAKLKKDDVFQCDHCESCFMNIQDTIDHLKYSHCLDYYKIYYWCVKCATVFSKPFELQEHFLKCSFKEKIVRLFKSNNSVFCLMCEFETDDVNEARTHLKSCRIKNVVVSDDVIEID
ncbi:unnamed protein product [Phaedon cochleariae]|uniref:C2H2-type domain-containing protein n=1 Tax=Phaedon cochleariae TaxID=80249 RepID=A0A9P0DNX2_PHACE|nr:unnamed protein product [Phaedon cochleariae]